MNLKEELTKENSKEQVMKIVTWVGNSQPRFTKLVNSYLEGNYRITQRAAWVLSYCVEYHPKLVEPHLKILILFLKKPGIHDAVKRNTIRLLQFIEIPRKFYGTITKICFDFLQSKEEPIAVKVFSLTVLYQISKAVPDLQNELRLIIEDQLPYSKPAFLSRAQKILYDLNKNSK